MKFEMIEFFSIIFKKASVIVFVSYADYLMVISNTTFKAYFIANSISIIVFSKRNNSESIEINIEDCNLNDDPFLVQSFLYLTKFNTNPISVKKKIQFNKQLRDFLNNNNDNNSISILECKTNTHAIENVLVVNQIDKINHVFINARNLADIWLLKPLFFDSLRYLSHGDINFSLERYVQIDIDDAPSATRIFPQDVFEILKLQQKLSTGYFYHNTFKFKFNVGCCGYFFQPGNKLENEAEKLLIGILKSKYNLKTYTSIFYR